MDIRSIFLWGCIFFTSMTAIGLVIMGRSLLWAIIGGGITIIFAFCLDFAGSECFGYPRLLLTPIEKENHK